MTEDEMAGWDGQGILPGMLQSMGSQSETRLSD